jgi:hypothetical protein
MTRPVGFGRIYHEDVVSSACLAPSLPPLPLPTSSQLVFAAVFTTLEPGWDMWTAFYHCMITAATVGYGATAVPSPVLE